jgi:hypothetical protein
MKFIDALINVQKDDANKNGWFNLEQFCNIAKLDEYDIDSEKVYTRITAYWVERWLCTDTWVGTQAIYLDDRLVGATTQTARKNDIHLKFIGKAEAEVVCEWIRACKNPDEDEYPILTPEELSQEIGQ